MGGRNSWLFLIQKANEVLDLLPRFRKGSHLLNALLPRSMTGTLQSQAKPVSCHMRLKRIFPQ
jgi:hypothetical protein